MYCVYNYAENILQKNDKLTQSVFAIDCNCDELRINLINVLSVPVQSQHFVIILLLASSVMLIVSFAYCSYFMFTLIYLFPDLRWWHSHLWRSEVIVWSADSGMSQNSSACIVVDFIVSLATTDCPICWVNVNLLSVIWSYLIMWLIIIINIVCGHWLAVSHSGNIIGRINEAILHRAQLILGWVTVCGRVYCQPFRSTQPCIPPGSLNRVPVLICWGKGGNIHHLCW